MIIHIDGKAEELLEFVKGMQFPVAMGFADLEDEETKREIAEEVRKNFEMDDALAEEEQLFTEVKKQTGASENLAEMTIELHRADLIALLAEANMLSMRGRELAAEIIEDWLDRKKYLRKH